MVGKKTSLEHRHHYFTGRWSDSKPR